jgi:sugar phosphate isomerase/epimerase
MKLCFSTLACPSWDLQTMVRAAADNGIGGIDFRGLQTEIDVTKLPAFNDGLPDTLAVFREYNLQIPCFNSSVTLMAVGDRWGQMLEECQRTATLASKTGTRFIRIFGGAPSKEMSHAEAVTLGQRRLRQLVKMTKPAGCQVLVETHDVWVTADQLAPLFEGTAADEVGLLWDCEHTYRKGEPPSQTVKVHGERLKHIHVKDSVRGPENRNTQLLLGKGDLPIASFVAALREGGYDGWYALETEKRWHPEAPEPEESIPNFARFMRAL